MPDRERPTHLDEASTAELAPGALPGRPAKLVKPDDAGATMVEYSLLIALIALTIIVAIQVMVQGNCELFSQAGSSVAIRPP